MAWQDLLIAIGSISFSIALFPMLRRGADRPPVFTAVLTSFWLYAYVLAFGTLGLWYSAITGAINGTLWATIGILKWRSSRKPAPNPIKVDLYGYAERVR